MISSKLIHNTPSFHQQRILIFTDSFSGRLDGIATSVESFIEGLVEAGHIVGVVAPTSHGGTTVHYSRKVAYWRVTSLRSPIDAYPMSWPSLHRFRKILEDFQPTLVSIQSIGPIGVAGFAASRQMRHRIALSWHTDFESYIKNYPASWIFILPATARLLTRIEGIRIRAILRKLNVASVIKQLFAALATGADAIVAPSVKTAAYVRNLNGTVPIFILPTGITLEEVSGTPIPARLRKTLQSPHFGEKIVYVGRLSREKDLEFLLRSMELVRKQKSRATLILVGPCKDRATRKLLQHYKHSFGASLVLAGPLPRSMLLDLYRKTNVFVMPSTTDTQSLALWEAVLCGIPVAVRDIDLCKTLEDCNDIYCGAKSIEEFAGLISVALDSSRSSIAEDPRGSLRPSPRERAQLFVSMFHKLEISDEENRASYFTALTDGPSMSWQAVPPPAPPDTA
jgi:glycosyltransferase involved in cell wall biosynthesis